MPSLSLEDGAVRMFLYTKGTVTDGCSRELQEFLQYVEQSDGQKAAEWESQRLKKFHDRVCAVKSNDEVEVRFMQLWEEKALERLEGRHEGRLEGRQEGAEVKLIEQVCKKLRKGKAAGEIAEDLEEDLEKVSQICEAARKFAPEYDCDEIYKELWGDPDEIEDEEDYVEEYE